MHDSVHSASLPDHDLSNSSSMLSLRHLRRWFSDWFGSGNIEAKGLAFSFAFGFLVRLVPEGIAFSSPIGWDTIYYAAVMRSGIIWSNWSSFFTSTWLLHSLTVPLYNLSGVDPFMLLKVVAPALYGLNVAGIYWFGRKLLRWDVKMCLVAVGLFAVQLASLRISWDLLRNTLGMGLLLFALPLIEHVGSKRGFVGFAVLSLLTVFAHEFAAVTWAVVISGLLVWHLIKGRFNIGSVRVLLAALPALIVLAIGVYLRFYPIRFEGAVSNYLSTGEDSVGRFLFMANYLVVNHPTCSYASYWSLFYEVILLFALLYLPYLYLVWKGYFKNDVLNLWLGLLIVGTFGCLILPFFALDLWDRWMFTLVYPFTFYAAYGIFRIFQSSNMRGSLFGRGARRVAVAGMVALISLGCGYLVTPALVNTDNGTVLPDIFSHFASAPTVPLEDVNGVTQAMQWLNVNMDNESFVLLHHAFFPWGLLYLNQSHVTVQFWQDSDKAIDLGLSHGLSHAYFVWWNEPISWYSLSFPEGFVSLVDFGHISIYVKGD